MSGPIIRKYGFPNFDNIFGKRELEHGVDDPNAAEKATSKTEKASEKPVTPPAESKKKS